MFIVTAQIEAEMRFDEYSTLVQRSVNEALVEWGRIALTEVRNAETRIMNRKTGPKEGSRWAASRGYGAGEHLPDTFDYVVAPPSLLHSFGLVVVYSKAPNAIWQELGTRGSRRAGLKKGGQRVKVGAVSSNVNVTEGNRGVSPLYFMRTGLRRAYPQGVAILQAALAGIGEYAGPGRTGRISSGTRPAFVDTTSMYNPAYGKGVRPAPGPLAR